MCKYSCYFDIQISSHKSTIIFQAAPHRLRFFRRAFPKMDGLQYKEASELCCNRRSTASEVSETVCKGFYASALLVRPNALTS